MDMDRDPKRLVFGLHPVLEALSARRRDVSLVYTTEDAVEKVARQREIPCERKSKSELDEIAGLGARHQGAIAIVGEYPYVELPELFAVERPLLLVLDSVTDPQNLGALVRSAYVLGAHGVVVPKDRAAQVTPAVVRASAGATEHMRIASVTNLVRALEECKERGVWIVGAVAGGPEGEARMPWEVDFREPSALVIGAEHSGLRRLVAKVCDIHVTIPMAGRLGSLNASAAGAALLYEAARQRSEPARAG
jgi:23S rRNA (guanosine2251-2'-O)-methyltransferase